MTGEKAKQYYESISIYGIEDTLPKKSALEHCEPKEVISEDEIIVIFEGYNKQGFQKYNNIEELAQELIHTKEMLSTLNKDFKE